MGTDHPSARTRAVRAHSSKVTPAPSSVPTRYSAAWITFRAVTTRIAEIDITAAITQNEISCQRSATVTLLMDADIRVLGLKKSRESIRKEWERHTQNLRKYRILLTERPYMWWSGKPIQGFPETFPRKSRDAAPAQSQSSLLEGHSDPEIEEFLKLERDIPF